MQNDIRELRTAKSLSQEDLAQALGVSRQTINSIEKERYTPSLPLAIALARFFETNRRGGLPCQRQRVTGKVAECTRSGDRAGHFRYSACSWVQPCWQLMWVGVAGIASGSSVAAAEAARRLGEVRAGCYLLGLGCGALGDRDGYPYSSGWWRP